MEKARLRIGLLENSCAQLKSNAGVCEMQVLDLRTLHPMTRDMELIRKILMRIEKDSQMDGTREFYFNTAEEFGFKGSSDEDIAYNFSLLVKAGFVDGAASVSVPVTVRSLTWEGHEFLDNIKSDTIWAKTKEKIKDIPTVSLKVVADVATAIVKAHLGLK